MESSEKQVTAEQLAMPKIRQAKIRYAKDGLSCVVRLNLTNIYEAIGILGIVGKDMEDLVQIPKHIRQQQMMANRQALAGGDGVLEGARKNKGFFNKVFR